MALFIICHQTLPEYQVPPDARILWLNAKPPTQSTELEVIRGYDYFAHPEAEHALLSGGLGSFAIGRYLHQSGLNPETVTLWQYRKFLLRRALGRPAPNYPGMQILGSDMAAATRVGEDRPSAEGFMVVKPLRVDSVANQYIRSHNVVDLLNYVSVAAAEGLLGRDKVMPFLNGRLLSPGGIELGTYPTAWWKASIVRLERASRAFIDRHAAFDPEHPYQKRAVAFCQERLGSHFLLERLRAIHGDTVPGETFGTMHTVTNEAAYHGGS